MRHNSLTFVLCLGMAASVTAGQTVKRQASVNTYSADGAMTAQTLSFYDASNLCVMQLAYSSNYQGGLALSGTSLFTYDEQGIILWEGNSGNSVQYFYTYNEQGQLIKKARHYYYPNNPSWKDYEVNEQDHTDYYYNEDGTLEHTEMNDYSKTKVYYQYTDGVLTVSEKWTEHTNWTDYSHYDAVDSRTYYTYDEAGNCISQLTKTVTDGVEAENGNENTYSYNEQGLLISDVIYDTWSTVAHEYTYDTDGDLEVVQNRIYNSYTDSWSDGAKNTYAYGYYSADRIATNITTAALETEPTTIVVTLSAPADAEGLDGYFTLIDGNLSAEAFLLEADGTLLITGQSLGDHTLRLIGSYNGAPANMSEEVTFTVRIDLATPQNVRFTQKEYSGDATWGSWQCTIVWDAPEASDYQVTGYRWKVGSNSGTTSADVQTASFYNYMFGTPEDVTIEVRAIYNVGESEPATMVFNNGEIDDVITSHPHNYLTYVTTDGEPTILHHLYVANGSSVRDEVNYASVELTLNGQPLTRNDNAGLIQVWDAETHLWVDSRKSEIRTNERGLRSQINEYVSINGEWVLISQDNVLFEDPDNTNKITGYNHYSYDENGNQTEYYTYQRYEIKSASNPWGNPIAVNDTLYNADGKLYGAITREMSGYDVNNSQMYPSVTRYYFENNEFIPVLRTLNEYADKALCGITEQSWNGEDWQTISSMQYTGYEKSDAYSITHTVKDIMIDLDAEDNNVAMWEAPVRTADLTRYDIYLDDVFYATVNAETGEYNFANAALPETAKGIHEIRIMALYNDDESCVSLPAEVEIISVDKTVAITSTLANGENCVEMYDIQGRRIDNATTGSIVIIKTTDSENQSFTRTIIFK